MSEVYLYTLVDVFHPGDRALSGARDLFAVVQSGTESHSQVKNLGPVL